MMLQIRNMESNRCIDVVKHELFKLGLPYKSVQLGRVELRKKVSQEKIDLIENALRSSGFELLNDKKVIFIAKIKEAVHEFIYLSDNLPKINFSDYISKKVNRDYTFISNLFSGTQGITIEKYIISQKIARVKEMLIYDKLSLSEIAFRLQYSSMAHLSNQFKKVTGLSPSFYRQISTAHSPKK